MNSLFVDTAGWLCLLDPNEALHAETDEAYQQAVAAGTKFLTTNYVITELVALLTARRRVPRPRLLEIVESVRLAPIVELVYIDMRIDQEAWNLLKTRDDKEWSLVDASSFVIMRERGIAEALTTDKHFVQAGFTRLPLGQ